MKFGRILYPALAAFVAGALLAPSGGRGGLLRSVHSLEAKLKSAQPPAAGKLELKGAGEGDTRLSHLLSALEESSALKRGHDLYAATKGMSAEEIVEMMAAAKKLPPESGKAVQKALLERWFDIDPAASEAWVRARPGDIEAWMAWAAHFPERGLQEVHANPDAQRALFMWEAAMQAQTKLGPGTKPQEVAAKVASMPADRVRDQVLAGIISSWAREDAAAALAFTRGLPDAKLRRNAAAEAVRAISQTDAVQALQIATGADLNFRSAHEASAFYSNLAVKAVKKDREATRQWVEHLPEGERSGPAKVVATDWAQSDPAAALTWSAANGVDPAAIVGDSMMNHPEDTFRWIQAQPAGVRRDQMLEKALLSNSKLTDGTSTANQAAVLSSLGQLSADAQLRVAGRFGAIGNGSKEDLARSNAWIAALDDGPMRLAAIKSAGRHYVGNPDQFQFADAPSQDAALQGMAQAATGEKATAFALKISDPQAQQDAFESFMPDWLHKEPDKAEAWIQKMGTNIPPEWIDEWRTESAWSR